MRKVERRLPAPLHRHLPHVRDASILLDGGSDDELELRALVSQAFELRGGPWVVEAVGEILNWHDRRQLRWLERRQTRQAAIIRLLRETDPARIIVQTRVAA